MTQIAIQIFYPLLTPVRRCKRCKSLVAGWQLNFVWSHFQRRLSLNRGPSDPSLCLSCCLFFRNAPPPGPCPALRRGEGSGVRTALPQVKDAEALYRVLEADWPQMDWRRALCPEAAEAFVGSPPVPAAQLLPPPPPSWRGRWKGGGPRGRQGVVVVGPVWVAQEPMPVHTPCCCCPHLFLCDRLFSAARITPGVPALRSPPPHLSALSASDQGDAISPDS